MQVRISLLGTLAAACLLRSVSLRIPPELTTPNYRTREITGIGPQPGAQRQDPSNVIKVGDRYFVWYTRRKAGVRQTQRGVLPLTRRIDS